MGSEHNFVFIRKNGTQADIFLRANAVFDAKGNYDGAVACVIETK